MKCNVCKSEVDHADVDTDDGREHVCAEHLVPQGSTNCCKHLIDKNLNWFCLVSGKKTFVRQLSPSEAKHLLSNCGPNCSNLEIEAVNIAQLQGNTEDRIRLALG